MKYCLIVTWFKNLDVNRRTILFKYIFRDDSNEDICVCPDFMTCEEKDTSDMDREDMLHLIYGCGFVVFFIVLISKYTTITSGRWFQTVKLCPHWPEVRFTEILISKSLIWKKSGSQSRYWIDHQSVHHNLYLNHKEPLLLNDLDLYILIFLAMTDRMKLYHLIHDRSIVYYRGIIYII